MKKKIILMLLLLKSEPKSKSFNCLFLEAYKEALGFANCLTPIGPNLDFMCIEALVFGTSEEGGGVNVNHSANFSHILPHFHTFPCLLFSFSVFFLGTLEFFG